MNNGVHANSVGGAAAGRANRRRGPETAPEIAAAPFISISIEPIDARMWPIHPPGWLQPEAPAAEPSWSGLNVERRHRIPAPDFVHFPLAAFGRAAEPDCGREPLPGSVNPTIPHSALELLGWDPRAFGSNKEPK
jgi:hypothetical protein